jgi:cytochrome c-type biogenesis protein
MNFLQEILNNSNFPLLSAFILGLLTAISPCPLATNITAIGFISKDVENKKKVLYNGLFYTLGRMITYTVLAWILIALLKEGESIFKVEKVVARYGEMILAPILLLIGLFMLFSKYIHLPKFGLSVKQEKMKKKNYFSALILGLLFALAFCPSSGVFFFGMLVPMAVVAKTGYLLPIVFSIATAMPVIIVAFLLAFSISSIGKFYNKMTVIEKWIRIIVGVLFVAIGVYYLIIFFF